MNNDTRIALAISGGGYRSTLFALGTLWRLNEFGVLPKLKTITSVSGGSIVSAWLGHNWDKLEFNSHDGVATNFEPIVAKPIEQFCSRGIDIKAGLSGLFSFRESIGDKIARAYDKHLFKGAHISTLPDEGPEFVFYSTNYQTGSGFQISKESLYDYKIGEYPAPNISLAEAVGMSSAFPPILSPVHFDTDPSKWTGGKCKSIGLKTRLILTDGGVYDNLGLEKIWKRKDKYSHILVCDAGAPFAVTNKVKSNWVSQLFRMTDLMASQQRALRKRILFANFNDLDEQKCHKKYGGTYFAISSKIKKYKPEEPAMTSDSDISNNLQNIRTRLNAFSEQEQGQLINWGYALTDTAIRKHVKPIVQSDLLKRGDWPKPKYKL